MNLIKLSFQIIIFLRLVWKFDFESVFHPTSQFMEWYTKVLYLWTDNAAQYINDNAVKIDWIEKSVKDSIQYE